MFRFFLVLPFLMLSCGYMPISAYTKKALGEKIYASVYIPVESPEFAVNVTDAVREAIIERFKGRLVSESENADSFIKIDDITHSTQNLKINSNGLTTLKRVTVVLKATITKKNKVIQNVKGSGSYDYSTLESSGSKAADLGAINEASKKALDDIILKISVFTI